MLLGNSLRLVNLPGGKFRLESGGYCNQSVWRSIRQLAAILVDKSNMNFHITHYAPHKKQET